MTVSRSDCHRARLRQQLETTLVSAATSGEIAPSIDAAMKLIEPGLRTRLCGQVLAKALIDLSIRHAAEAAPAPDPYAKLARRLVDVGVCDQSEVDAALGRVLNIGVDQGWLEAGLYDRLSAAVGNEPVAKGLLELIERRAISADEGRPGV